MASAKHVRKILSVAPPKGMSKAAVDAAIKKVQQMRQDGKVTKVKIKPIYLHAAR